MLESTSAWPWPPRRLHDGSWSVAYLPSLLKEPAPQVLAARPQSSASSRLRAFTPLVSFFLRINDPRLCERSRPPLPTPPRCSKAAANREAARSGGRLGHRSCPEKVSQVPSQTKGYLGQDLYQPLHVLPRCPSDVSTLPAPLEDERVEHKASQAGADQGNGPVNYLRESPLSFTASPCIVIRRPSMPVRAPPQIGR